MKQINFFYREKLGERNYVEDLGLDGRINLKRVLRNGIGGRGLLSSGCGWKKWWAVKYTAVKLRVTSWSQIDTCVQKSKCESHTDK
jgi:hypothetical protein